MNAMRRTTVFGIVLASFLSAGGGVCFAQQRAAQPEGQRLLKMARITGGLIVHLGCGDGRLTSELGRSGRFLVQGLDRDAETIAQARQKLSDAGVYGRTSVRRISGDRLPYVDNLVNLIVVDKPLGIARSELMRALAPLGVLLVRSDDGWEKHIKAWPDTIDEWTHFLHGPDNNAVAHDSVVGPPRHLQWIADPRHLRSHEHLNGVSAVVSAHGRIFSIIDEGPTAAVAAPSRWRLVARDAFNGTLLWKRELGPWEGHFRLFRSGPPDIARRLVAVGDRVYVTLGYGKAVAAFDAATGQTIRTYEATEGAIEIVYANGCLFVVVGTIDEAAWRKAAQRYYPTPPPRHKGIVAVAADTGRVLWRRTDQDTEATLPATLAVSGKRVFLQNTRQVVCFDAESGNVLWRTDRPVYTTRLAWSTPTLVVHDHIILSADGSTGGVPADVRRGEDHVKWILSDQDIRKHPRGDVVALSTETGKQLWKGDSLQGFCSPGDVLVIGDRVWSGANVSTVQAAFNVAVNLKTGSLESQTQTVPPIGGHTRCYRNKATERYLVLGTTGVDFINVDDWSLDANAWVRGTCQYGVMPCNGLLYVPSDSCACRPNARLHGFTAMAPERDSEVRNRTSRGSEATNRLERGPAYKTATRDKRTSAATDWPTYRKDFARSGWTRAPISSTVHATWQTTLGGRLTSLTISSGQVYVSQVDTHRIYALDLDSGKVIWSRTVGGRVDSPPTLSQDLVVFGCHDGFVYCLRARDGDFVWRFRAAPEERFLVAREQVESVWPVHGSVLVRNGLVWCAAGRSSYLDGGLTLTALQLTTGELVVEKRLDARDTEAWRIPQKDTKRAFRNVVPGTQPDILSSSNDAIFMGWSCFDGDGRLVEDREPHLFSATGFLDTTWWHRTYWQYGTWMRGGFGGWPLAARLLPAGRLLVVTDDTIFGFGREKFDSGNGGDVHAGHIGVVKEDYQDIGHVDQSRNPYLLFSENKPTGDNVKWRRQPAVPRRWQTHVPIVVRGMLLADQMLWIAGPNAKKDNQSLAELGTVQPSQLIAVSVSNGESVAQYELTASPVLDGMAAIPGRLFVACVDGTVRAFVDR